MLPFNRLVATVTRSLFIGACALLLAGCGVLPGKSPQKPVTDYVLNAGLAPGAMGAVTSGSDSCLSVQVMLPRTAAGFNTSRMAYTDQRDSLRYFAYSQWADSPAYMVQPLLVRGLQESGVFRTVVKSPSPISTRFRLIADELAIVQIFQGLGSTLRVAVRLQLFDAREGRLAFDVPVGLERAADANAEAGVQAANALTAELIELVATRTREAADSRALCSE